MGIIYFIILMSVIVIIHEMGHLLAAKAFNVYCPEFSIGMGPKLFGKKIGETTYNVRAFPIGGFVAMAGDNENNLESKVKLDNIPDERTVLGIAKWKKIIIMLAGVFMNLVLALVLTCIIFLNQGAIVGDSPAEFGKVSINQPVANAGILEGDHIVKVIFADGTVVTNPDNFNEVLVYLLANKGDIIFTVEREDEVFTTTVVPNYDAENDKYIIGIEIPQGEIIKVTAFNVIPVSTNFLVTTSKLIYNSLIQIILGRGLENVAGPVGIYSLSNDAAQQGVSSFLFLIALLSLNIGIFNLLPLPVLDGGRVLLTLIEIIFRRKLNPRIENAIMTFSVAILIGFMLFATFQDIIKLF
jgi:regulator of sigma E protease